MGVKSSVVIALKDRAIRVLRAGHFGVTADLRCHLRVPFEAACWLARRGSFSSYRYYVSFFKCFLGTSNKFGNEFLLARRSLRISELSCASALIDITANSHWRACLSRRFGIVGCEVDHPIFLQITFPLGSVSASKPRSDRGLSAFFIGRG